MSEKWNIIEVFMFLLDHYGFFFLHCQSFATSLLPRILLYHHCKVFVALPSPSFLVIGKLLLGFVIFFVAFYRGFFHVVELLLCSLWWLLNFLLCSLSWSLPWFLINTILFYFSQFFFSCFKLNFLLHCQIYYCRILQYIIYMVVMVVVVMCLN